MRIRAVFLHFEDKKEYFLGHNNSNRGGQGSNQQKLGNWTMDIVNDIVQNVWDWRFEWHLAFIKNNLHFFLFISFKDKLRKIEQLQLLQHMKMKIFKSRDLSDNWIRTRWYTLKFFKLLSCDCSVQFRYICFRALFEAVV